MYYYDAYMNFLKTGEGFEGNGVYNVVDAGCTYRFDSVDVENDHVYLYNNGFYSINEPSSNLIYFRGFGSDADS